MGELFVILIGGAIGIIIQYFVMKAAVRNGTIEAQAHLAYHTNSKVALRDGIVKDGVIAAMNEKEHQFLIGLHHTIQDAVKAAVEQNNTNLQ